MKYILVEMYLGFLFHGITGELQLADNTKVTKYPHLVSSEKLNEIKDKIKNIVYYCDDQNSKNLYKCNMLILTEDGKLYTLSMNKITSGNGVEYPTRNTGDFTELKIKEGTTVKQVVTRDGLSLALLSNGEIYGWGYNTYGILGPKYEIGEYRNPSKTRRLTS